MLNNITFVISLFFIIDIATHLYAQEDLLQQSKQSKQSKLYYGVEYLFPMRDSRNIETYNFDVYYQISKFNKLNLSISAGATFTYATGDITLLKVELAQRRFKEVKFNNTAFGMGPGLLIDWKFLPSHKFSLHFEGIGNLIIYNEKFPAGGDQYNFMLRTGPLLQYELSQSNTIGLGYHWAHVSNGQGKVPENPSYDAEGLFIRFISLF